MTANYSRPFQVPDEINKTNSSSSTQRMQPVQVTEDQPAPPKSSLFGCLKRGKAKSQPSEDEPQTQRHIRSRRDSQAVYKDPKRTASDEALNEERKIAKAEAKEYKDQKRARKAKESAQRQIIGGVAWGFDPSAGMRSSTEETEFEGCFVSGRMARPEEAGEYEIDRLGRLTGRRWTKLGTWGVEHGGPGRDGNFVYGSLKGKEPDKLPSQIPNGLN